MADLVACENEYREAGFRLESRAKLVLEFLTAFFGTVPNAVVL